VQGQFRSMRFLTSTLVFTSIIFAIAPALDAAPVPKWGNPFKKAYKCIKRAIKGPPPPVGVVPPPPLVYHIEDLAGDCPDNNVITGLFARLHDLHYETSEGVFRKAGTVATVDHKYQEIAGRVAAGFNGPPPYVLTDLTSVDDVVDVIKKLLRNAQDRLLDGIITDQIAAMDDDAQSGAVTTAIGLMPDARRGVLQAVLTGLMPVIQNSGTNKMTASNLAIAFGPSLIPNPGTDMAAITKTTTYSGVFQKILENEHALLN